MNTTFTASGPTASRAAKRKTPTSGYSQSSASRRWPVAPGAGQEGFTLLELIIVLVVLAAAAVLVVPAIGSWRDDFVFRDAVGRLEASLALARVQAMRSGRAIRVQAQPGDGALQVGERVISLGPGGRVLYLGTAGGAARSEAGIVRFYPDGSADNGLIRLKGPKHTLEVWVNPLGGRSRLVWLGG